MSRSTLNILLTTDERYAQHCAVCLRSIIDNNPDSQLNVVIAGLDLSLNTQKKLSDTAKGAHCEVRYTAFDAHKLADFPQIGIYPKDIYLRLWVEDFFPNEERVLYLDVDIIVVDSLKPLFELDMKGNLLAAVDIPDATSHDRCHLPTEYNYFNSGVLLFNVPLWTSGNCRELVRKFLASNAEIALNPDQDALNGCFYDRRITLGYEWNLISPFFRKEGFPSISPVDMGKIRQSAKVIHFNGAGGKPWQFTSLHPYQPKYMAYLKETPYHDFLPPDFSMLNSVKKQLRKHFGLDGFAPMKPNELKGN
jgi:lipopolysaccharide biosynthesis glycosyltransferase